LRAGLVTNTTGSAATLSGWIDYNADGVFDNATERAQVAVPNGTIATPGTTAGVVTLTFPEVPLGSIGQTYARFRLSTDTAAASPTGAASDGEVEDYVARISLPSTGTVGSQVKISNGQGGLAAGSLDASDFFGSSVASLGDLDGYGVGDMAVGAENDESTGGDPGEGAVYVLLMNSNGTVNSQVKISDGEGGLAAGSLDGGDSFGSAVASLGDLDGDGVGDMAVGARDDGTGAVYVLSLASLLDFGDAPDTGTGAGNYNTLSTDSGPAHLIDDQIFLGANIDGESEANADADGDDTDGALPDDEDGLNHPLADLTLTVGAQPTVNVIVTNTTGSAATLSGWIDYNADGVFDNATERAQAAVADGSTGDVVTLTFPAVPSLFVGTTYARFLLSSDTAGENPTGLAADGEVEA